MVSRERTRQFDPDQAVDTLTASQETSSLQRVLRRRWHGSPACIATPSGARPRRPRSAHRFAKRFEAGLAKLAAGLSKPRAQKTIAAIQQRIGRLKEKSRGIGQHYEITVTPDETGPMPPPSPGSRPRSRGPMLTHPGCLLPAQQ